MALGIDIGTTTISAAVLEDGQFLASETRANGAALLVCAGVRNDEQDVEKITQTRTIRRAMLFERYPDIHSIGVTGQMHGILWMRMRQSAVHLGTPRQSVRCTHARDLAATHEAAACRTANRKLGAVSHARLILLPRQAMVW